MGIKYQRNLVINFWGTKENYTYYTLNNITKNLPFVKPPFSSLHNILITSHHIRRLVITAYEVNNRDELDKAESI
jgi:hypothetical protein